MKLSKLIDTLFYLSCIAIFLGVNGKASQVTIVILIALLGLISLFYELGRLKRIQNCKTLVDGIVTTVTRLEFNSADYNYEVMVTFSNPENASLITKSFKIFSLKTPKSGSKFKICFNASDPQRSEMMVNIGFFWRLAIVLKILVLAYLVGSIL